MRTVNESQQLLIEALGRQSHFWGLGKITGELYAVLYTTDHPLTLGDLATELGVTKGNVSVAMHRLEDLAMVRRQFITGNRRVYFTAETDFWAIARRFLERRHRPDFAETFRLVRASLEKAEHPPLDPASVFVTDRIRTLQRFYENLDEITEILLSVDSEQLESLIALIGLDSVETEPRE